MSTVNDLIDQIENAELRNRLQAEVRKLAKKKKFGLVFEDHLPECTPLYDIPVSVGKSVSLKDGKANEIYKVVNIVDGKATCVKNGVEELFEFDVNKLVVTAVFGEPIYPYLKPIDKVCNAPDSDLWHTLIEADNYHALQLLEYMYAGKVDCIYIDPPYNTGAKDWKYNNDYVDSNDEYRHSKWLSFMQKRLQLAKKLLNPQDSVLIVTIDEKEYLHLGCLLEETFPEANIQMISSVINPKGNRRDNHFSRCEEYIFYIFLGKSCIATNGQDMLRESLANTTSKTSIRLRALLRGASNHGRRIDRPNLFYPLLFEKSTGKFAGHGPVLSITQNKDEYIPPDGLVAMWPIGSNNIELTWNLQPSTLMDKHKKHFLTFSKWDGKGRVAYYLSASQEKNFEQGMYNIIGTDSDGAYIIEQKREITKDIRPLSVWNKKLHSASEYGTTFLNNIFNSRVFSFPKSIYAVKDTINFIIANKQTALIVDFFSGSGTTLHAINLLNAEDGGHRRCIMVTNNEVSDEESKALKNKGISPGDDEWEQLGIARYVTWPRTKCSIMGVDVNGKALDGEYFTTLKKECRTARKVTQVAFNSSLLSFDAKKSIVALMGKETLPQSLVKKDSHYIVSEKHKASIIFNLEYVDDWMAELEENDHITDIYIVTDNNKAFKKLKEEIQDLMGDIVTEEPMKLPMADGFKANVEYFKLGFLDKTMVRIGRQFREMLPILWMKSGALGARPELTGTTVPDMLVLPQNKMAVLVNENMFFDFKQQVDQYPEIEYVYIVTNYDNGYRAKIAELNVKNTYQLYRDYLDNFRINYRREN